MRALGGLARQADLRGNRERGLDMRRRQAEPGEDAAPRRDRIISW
jgi:hypothetical protein